MTNKLLDYTLDYINKDEEHVNFRLNLVLGIFALTLYVIMAISSYLLAKFIFSYAALRVEWLSILFEYPMLYMVFLFAAAFGIYLLFDKMLDAWVMEDAEDDEIEE